MKTFSGKKSRIERERESERCGEENPPSIDEKNQDTDAPELYLYMLCSENEQLKQELTTYLNYRSLMDYANRQKTP